MNEAIEKSPLISRVIKTELVDWKKFQYIQQDDFKNWTSEAKERLKQSVFQNNFAQPFYVWHNQTNGVIYCLDGRHRTLVLEELEKDGVSVSDLLPATFIHCENLQQAAELVLIYSSIYAKVSQQGLFDFIQMYDLEYEDIKKRMDIPDFSIERFEQKFDMFDVSNVEEAETELQSDIIIVNPGDIFCLNNHRIVCGSFIDAKTVEILMNGKKARILNCDPPYNLPANFFTNTTEKRHTDFAMGSGEMSDNEFVDFLKLIMSRAVEHSLPGSIHYIFMDWRHVWHMTEAARTVYGSAIPKQLCVWNKDLMANGSFYRAKHELCFVFSNDQAKSLWNKDFLDHGGTYKDNNELVFIFKAGDDDVKHLSHLDLKDRIRSNIWNYPSATSTANPDRFELKNHPTPKPVQMIADAILDTTNEGDIVIDWFLGSGTCLVACEQTRRVCYATEIEPKYIQKIIQRYNSFCNKNGIEVNFSHVNGTLTLNDFKNE